MQLEKKSSKVALNASRPFTCIDNLDEMKQTKTDASVILILFICHFGFIYLLILHIMNLYV